MPEPRFTNNLIYLDLEGVELEFVRDRRVNNVWPYQMHVSRDGEPHCDFWMSREHAIRLAHALLKAAQEDSPSE